MMRFFAAIGTVGFVACFVGVSPATPAVVRLHNSSLAKHRCPAWPSGTGLLPDGDLRLALDPGDKLFEYQKGQPFAPKWAPVKRGNVDFNGSSYWPAAAPNNVCTIDLDGLTAGTIHPNRFATTPSAGYTVTFILTGNGFCPPSVKTLEVEAAGQSQQFTWDVNSQGSASNGTYQPETWGFTATSSSTTLTFKSLDPKNAHCGPVIGAVSVVPD